MHAMPEIFKSAIKILNINYKYLLNNVNNVRNRIENCVQK